MKRTTRRLRFRGRPYSRIESQYIRQAGTEAAWMKAAGQSYRPEVFTALFSAVKPWKWLPRPGVRFRSTEGELYLVIEIWFRRPDAINGLEEMEFVDWNLARISNSFEGHTEWKYLDGNHCIPMKGYKLPEKRQMASPAESQSLFDPGDGSTYLVDAHRRGINEFTRLTIDDA